MVDAFHVLIKQADEAPFMDFQLKDLQIRLGKYDKKSFDGINVNLLIGMFKK